jgi:hypothetical protein
METFSAFKPLRAGLIVIGLLSPGQAFAFDLTGAWASDGVLNAIKAKAAKCTITSRRQDGDMTVLTANCATSIMTSTLQFRYKPVDDNTLVRDFPDIKDMTLKYFRCPM